MWERLTIDTSAAVSNSNLQLVSEAEYPATWEPGIKAPIVSFSFLTWPTLNKPGL